MLLFLSSCSVFFRSCLHGCLEQLKNLSCLCIQNASGTRYLLYAITELGTAYLFKLGNLSSYTSGSVFSQSDLVEFDVQMDLKITAVAATFGCLLLGRQDGSVTCYKLGILEQSAPG